MILLIEGIDKSGKSTLLKDLQAERNVVVFKNKIKPEGKSQLSIGRTNGIYLGAYQLATQLQDLTVFDRSHITEIVYSSRRGYEALFYVDWLHLEETFDMLLVYMSAPSAVIAKRFKEDGEDYITEGEIDILLSRYDTYLARTKIKTLKLSSLDDRQENLKKLINFIDGHLRNKRSDSVS